MNPPPPLPSQNIPVPLPKKNGFFAWLSKPLVMVCAMGLLGFLAIAAFIALGLWVIGRGAPGVGLANYTAHGGFAPHGLSGIWSAVIVCCRAALRRALISRR